MLKPNSNTGMYDPVWSIVNNDAGYYEGDLWPYYWQTFFNGCAKNLFHNLLHHEQGLLCLYEGLQYEQYAQRHGMKHARSVLVAMSRHDNNHPGQKGDDFQIVSGTARLVLDNLEPEDAPFRSDIETYLFATVSKHLKTIPAPDAPEYLRDGIALIRDADLIQTFRPEWKQQVLFGLAAEVGITPYQMLLGQADFLRRIEFQSRWGREKYGPARAERLSDLEQAIGQLEKYLKK